MKRLRDRDVHIHPSKLSNVLNGVRRFGIKEKHFISEVLGVPDEILFPDRDQVGWAVARLYGVKRSDITGS